MQFNQIYSLLFIFISVNGKSIFETKPEHIFTVYTLNKKQTRCKVHIILIVCVNTITKQFVEDSRNTTVPLIYK